MRREGLQEQDQLCVSTEASLKCIRLGRFLTAACRIRLSAHFHAEYLLDREHYMDWLVSSLENSPQGKTPIWLLITQIYWKDLLQYRKYGRRLSAALLGHFSEVCHSTFSAHIMLSY